MNLKKIKQIPTPFPSHKVTIKAIKRWNGYANIWQPPCNAIDYLYRQEKAATIIIIKQREASIKILIECSDSIYERIKLDFVRIMGDKFIWKD